MSSPDDAIAADVDRVGWSCISIRDIDPPFAYTVGLMKTHDHPELIIFGRPDDAHSILSDLVSAIASGSRLDTPTEYDVLDGFPIGTRPVDESHHETYLGYAMGYVRRIGRIGELAAVQVYVPEALTAFIRINQLRLNRLRSTETRCSANSIERDEMGTDW
ncbi:MAG: DUF4262 domain-containing protein [Pirellulaceae bacterium]